MDQTISIAIDGPVASGKSTVGRIVARGLHCRFLDTGMMYRAVALEGIRRGIDLDDDEVVTALAERMTIRVADSSRGSRLMVDGEDVSDRLDSVDVEQGASRVAVVSGVRRALVSQQQDIAAEGDIVMAGRDIGTVVLRGATLKVYLDAPVETRAWRRYEERRHQPGAPDYARTLELLAARDRMDAARDDSPLIAAEDAVTIAADDLDAQTIALRILALVGSR